MFLISKPTAVSEHVMFLLCCFVVLEFGRLGITLYLLAVWLQKRLEGGGRSITDHEYQQRVCFFVLAILSLGNRERLRNWSETSIFVSTITRVTADIAARII